MATKKKAAKKKAKAKPRRPAYEAEMKQEVDGIKQEVAGISDAVSQLTNTVGQLAETVTTVVSANAKDRPVSKKNLYGSDDYEVGQDNERLMNTYGPSEEALEPAQIDVVDGPTHKQKMDAEAFNHEVLTIKVHDSTDEDDEPVPSVINGGTSQYFIRGRSQPVKRKFVEVLARMKTTRYTQQIVKDGNGDEHYSMVPHTALRFPFSVEHDPSGKRGEEWLKKILAEG